MNSLLFLRYYSRCFLPQALGNSIDSAPLECYIWSRGKIRVTNKIASTYFNASVSCFLQAFFLELYLKLVLNSKEKPRKALSEAFGPLFKQLTHDEFGKVVVPNAVKMLKRNPELIMESVSLLLKLCSLDLSKYGGEFLPIVLPQARHSDEARRKEAFEAIKNIAMQSSDLDTISAMFKSVKSVLGGSLSHYNSLCLLFPMSKSIQLPKFCSARGFVCYLCC